MLGQPHFYNRTIRKLVVAFGSLFNDIQVVRYNKDVNKAGQIFKVPLSYGPKEKYITRITSDPDLTKSISTLVPRISFEMTGMSYDPSRKKMSTIQNFGLDSNNSLVTQFAPIPYDFDFSLSIYVRNTEDGTQIIEQILPFFTPDFTVSVNFIPSLSQKYDLPIKLESVSTNIDYEGETSTTRLIIWDLTFTLKGYIWPPVKSNTAQGLIGTYSTSAAAYGFAKSNIFIDTNVRDSQKVYVNYATGNNVFTTGETIRVEDKDITVKVVYFSNTVSGILVLSDLSKLVSANDVVTGDYSQAKYKVTATENSLVLASKVVVQANPLNSAADDQYGFTDNITEWPNTLI
jgi:hypothetical protein